ncbi:hypothetical protein ACQY0O_006998 [Thecaphora frezii]
MYSLGAALDSLQGRLGSLVGIGDSKIRHLAKAYPKGLLTETRQLLIKPEKQDGSWDDVRQSELEAETQPLLMEEPVKREGFWDGVRQSRLDRRLKALETEESASRKHFPDWTRADPASVVLREKAEAAKDMLQTYEDTWNNPWQTEEQKQRYRQYIKTEADADIKLIEKQLESFENQFPKEGNFQERLNDPKVKRLVRDRLLQHYHATRSVLHEASNILKQAEAKVEGLKKKIQDVPRSTDHPDGISRRNTNDK